MAHLKTRRFPASTPWGYEFPDGEKVVEVADEHATELLRISGGEFYEVLPGDPEHPDYEPPAPGADGPPADPDEPTGDPGADPDDPERTPIAEPDPDRNTGEPADSPTRTRQRTRQRTTE